jgi:hypothetical protein
MLKFTRYAVALMIIFAVAFSASAGDQRWMEMDKCEICRPMAQEPELMENTIWEHHSISNGLVSVTTVKEDVKALYTKTHEKMAAAVSRVLAGEKVEQCVMCSSLSAIVAKGLKMDYINTWQGNIVIMTSDDPEVVAEIQAWGKRTMDELHTFAAKHEGHGH